MSSQQFSSVKVKKTSTTCPNENGNLYVEGKSINKGTIKSYTAVAVSFALTASDLYDKNVIKIALTATATVSFPNASALLAALPYNTVVGDTFNVTIVETGGTALITFTLANSADASGTIVGKAIAALTTDTTVNAKIIITNITAPAYEIYLN